MRRKETQVREKVAQSCSAVFFFNDSWLRGGSKSRLAKAAGAEPSGSHNVQSTPFLDRSWKLRYIERLRAVAHEARFQVKRLNAPCAWSAFEGSDVI